MSLTILISSRQVLIALLQYLWSLSRCNQKVGLLQSVSFTILHRTPALEFDRWVVVIVSTASQSTIASEPAIVVVPVPVSGRTISITAIPIIPSTRVSVVVAARAGLVPLLIVAKASDSVVLVLIR